MSKFNVIFNRDFCKGCGLCAHVCPKNIISLDIENTNIKGYTPAKLIDDACIGCQSCAIMCPDSIISIEKMETEDVQ